MPIVFAIGFGVGWFLVALLEFLWKHRLFVLFFIAVWWMISTAADGIDYMKNGSIADQTSAISVSFEGTRDVSTRNMGSSEMWFSITIDNRSGKTLSEFEGHCGDYWFHDATPVANGSKVERSYYYVEQRMNPEKLEGCVFTEAEFS